MWLFSFSGIIQAVVKKMNKNIKLVLSLLVVIMALSLGKNIIAKISLERGAKAMTGLTLNIKSMDVGIFRTRVGIKGMELLNPEGFKERIMISMPELYLDYNLGAFIKGKTHFEEFRLNAEEVFVVRNEKGEINFDSLKIIEPEKKKGAATEKKGVPEIQIDLLKIKVGKVVFKDHSTRAPVTTEFNVNIDAEYRNIRNAYAFVGLVVWNALKDTRVPGFDVRNIKNKVSGISREFVANAAKIGEQIEKKGRATFEETKKTIMEILPLTGKGGGNAEK